MVYSFLENRVRRAYRGGKQLDRFTGKAVCEDSNRPEEWLASTVAAFNPDYAPVPHEGLSVCRSGEVFKDILEKNPEKLLGKRLCAQYRGKASILVKLLDSAERLVIQCHPTVEFARKYFNSPFGKTECWFFLETQKDACVYLGFQDGVTKEKWKACFDKQDVDGMLACLHRFPVQKGDLWFVDGGVPHAIGAGCLMIELQEPSDLMVIPEKVTPSGRKLSDIKLHGGLGWEKMFDCFRYTGASEAQIRAKYHRQAVFEANKLRYIVDSALTDKFSMGVLRVAGNAVLNAGDTYAVCVVTDGACVLRCGEDEPLPLAKGHSFFIGADSGTLSFTGNADLVLCFA